MLPVLLSCLTYANTLRNGFVYDDLVTIEEAPYLQDSTLLPRLFTPGYFAMTKELSYRPALTLSYFVDSALWGGAPAGFHLTNVVCHALCVFFLYWIGKALLPGEFWASLGAALFAVHPAATEAVNCVSFREDLLALFFCLVAVFCMIRKKGPGWLPTVLFLLSLLSKESGAVLPFLLLLWWPRTPEKKDFLRRLWPLGVMLFFFLVFRVTLLKWLGTGEKAPWNLADRLLIAPRVFALYLRLVLCPHPLSAEYVFSRLSGPLDPNFLIPLGLLTFSSCLALFLWRRGSPAGLGMMWFLVGLLPVSNLIPLPNPAAERFLYLPLAGAGLVYGSLGELFSGVRGKWLMRGGMMALLLPLSWMTIKRNRVWRDELTFCRDTVNKCPQSDRFLYNLASAYWEEGRMEEAETTFERLLERTPDHMDAKISLSALYVETGRTETAIQWLTKITQETPGAHQAWTDLAVVYHTLGRDEEALRAADQSVALSGGDPTALANRGRLLVKMGRLERAASDLQAAFEREPHVDLAVDLAILATERGLWDEAENWFDRAFVLSPGDPFVQRNYETFLLKRRSVLQ